MLAFCWRRPLKNFPEVTVFHQLPCLLPRTLPVEWRTETSQFERTIFSPKFVRTPLFLVFDYRPSLVHRGFVVDAYVNRHRPHHGRERASNIAPGGAILEVIKSAPHFHAFAVSFVV